MPWNRKLNRRLFLAEAAAGALALTSCRRSQSPLRLTRPASPVSPVRFTDITQAAGISLVQSRGGCGMFYFVEQEAAGAALLDTNGDGLLDIYFPQPKPIASCKSK